MSIKGRGLPPAQPHAGRSVGDEDDGASMADDDPALLAGAYAAAGLRRRGAPRGFAFDPAQFRR
jgi:hypothetical protein